MRLGISPTGSRREAALALAEAAVSGGLDAVWLGDGFVANTDFPGWAGGMESMVELAWLAGGLLAHRVYVEAASDAFAGHEVDRRAVSGTPAEIAAQLRRYRDLGVGDLSIVPGRDGASARRTVEVLVAEVLPALDA